MRPLARKWIRDILWLLYHRKSATRAEVVEGTGLDTGSVSRALKHLLRCGIVLSAGELESSGGRKAEVLQLNRQAGCFLGIDLTATHVRIGIVGLDGEVQRKSETELSFGQQLSASTILEGVDDVIRSLAAVERSRILAAGVSCPGTINEHKGSVTAVNLSWHQFHLVRELQDALKVPVVVEQDCRIRTMAEQWLEAARHRRNWLYVFVGDGVSIASVVDGRLLRGHDRMAGELGHIRIDTQSQDLCNCGKRGCLEAVCAAPHIVRQYLQRTPESAVAKHTMQAGDVFERARTGDADAVAVLDRAAHHLGLALSYVVSLLNPELILIGGEFARASDFLIPRIWAELQQNCLPVLLTNMSIQVSSPEPDIGIKGAALVAFRAALRHSSMFGLMPRVALTTSGRAAESEATGGTVTLHPRPSRNRTARAGSIA